MMAAMVLVQFFLPVFGNQGQPCPKALFDEVRAELTEVFGGVTAFVHSPAVGAWESDTGAVCRDEVMLFEVMSPTLDRQWWQRYRSTLEERFGQDEVLVRATLVETL